MAIAKVTPLLILLYGAIKLKPAPKTQKKSYRDMALLNMSTHVCFLM